jgi:hypothetical protein
MRSRSLILRDHEVRAVLAGTKVQHRVPVALREFQVTDTPGYDFIFRDRRALWNDFTKSDLLASKFAPYRVGDEAWVREAFRTVNDLPDPDPYVVMYAADGTRIPVPSAYQDAAGDIDYRAGEELQPSSRMPRWASRITLRVTSADVQRLGDTTNEDAEAMGWRGDGQADARDMFFAWDDRFSIDDWNASLWTWRIAFERVTG